MKQRTLLGITGLLKSMGINFYEIVDEIVDIHNERFYYIKKIKSKKRKRKGVE